jgi:hypothetical protein
LAHDGEKDTATDRTTTATPWGRWGRCRQSWPGRNRISFFGTATAFAHSNQVGNLPAASAFDGARDD